MASPISSFESALIVVFLTVQMSVARDVPYPGLLKEMPANCSHLDFCLEKHAKYPQEIIDALLTKKLQVTLAPSHESVSIRQGTIEEDDCVKSIRYGEIYEIVDEQDNIRVVVQSLKVFKQEIRIEQCVNPGPQIETIHFKSEELNIYNMNCVEKKMDYAFMVLTKDGEGVEFVKVKDGIPVCCSCRVLD